MYIVGTLRLTPNPAGTRQYSNGIISTNKVILFSLSLTKDSTYSISKVMVIQNPTA